MGLRSTADEVREDLPIVALDDATRSAVHGWLTADVEFNHWFLETTKRALADDELMELLAGYGESQETMTRAWSAFRDDANGEKLQGAIAVSQARMQALMSRG